jgi:DNA-binding MarR family transcriptional regulator
MDFKRKKTVKMTSKIPSKKDYEAAHDLLNTNKFAFLIHLADVLNRYIDIRFKDQIDWLKINALMIITRKGGVVNLSQLSGSMIRPKWTITKLVDTMESEGLLIRVRLKKDRRSILVKTTKQGLSSLEEFLILCDQAEKEILDSIEEKDLDTFKIISRLLISRLVEVTSNYHDSLFYFHRGNFYTALGRSDAALTNFKRSLETSREKLFILQIRKEIALLEAAK